MKNPWYISIFVGVSIVFLSTCNARAIRPDTPSVPLDYANSGMIRFVFEIPTTELSVIAVDANNRWDIVVTSDTVVQDHLYSYQGVKLQFSDENAGKAAGELAEKATFELVKHTPLSDSGLLHLTLTVIQDLLYHVGLAGEIFFIVLDDSIFY
jgi:hypothetical protein